MAPGILFVTMQPQAGLSLDQFHDWYNNEHGPTRLRLPAIFANGLRYRATDGEQPEFLAVYDVRDMALLTTSTYTDLRANRSPREAETIGQVAVERRFLDLACTQQTADFVAPEDVVEDEDEKNSRVLVFVEITIKPEAATIPEAEVAAVEALSRWYEEEHFPMLAKVPGWLRSRLYRPSTVDGAATGIGPARLVTLHEYTAVNGLGGAEHKASMATPRRDDVFACFVGHKARRTYRLFYVFGPGPRDLASPGALPPARAFSDGFTTTTPLAGKTAGGAVIQSSVTVARDGLVLPYVLEGSGAPDAPTVVFCNSLLTSLHMWDALVALLRVHRPHWRLLRYDVRGRHGLPAPAQPATMAMLADDLRALLDALRIRRVHALVGVSQGGASALQFALRHGNGEGGIVLDRLVACDFNIASSPANTAAWQERIAVAESGSDGIATLAAATVSRWFDAYTVAHKPETVQQTTAMVAANTVEGFHYGCQALWDYDMRTEAPGLRVPTLLVAGEGDGKGALVRAMDGFRGSIGTVGAELRVVPQAGHLPMVENPEGFWAAISDFV